MGQKKLIIIGAGIAGLSAGCYAQMNGYASSIYEMHTIPGGLCTAWTRGGYTFNGSIQFLAGSAQDGMMHPLWCELGALQGKKIINHDEFCSYTDRDGKVCKFHADVELLERELIVYSPEDQEPVRELCSLIKRFKSFKPPVDKATEVMNFLDYVKMMPSMVRDMSLYRDFLKYGKTSMGDFADKLKNRDLAGMLTSVWGSEIPLSLFIATMAWYSNHTSGYPEGGSLEFAKSIEKRYIGLGGEIKYGKQVEKILVEDNKAIGIRLQDGTECYSDMVLSAADGYSTIYRMLGGKYVSKEINDWYERVPTYPAYIQVSLGIGLDLSKEPKALYYQLRDPIAIAGKDVHYMIVHNYSFDKTLAPKGKTSVVVHFFTDHRYWQETYNDRKRYADEKKAIAEAVIDELDRRFDGLRENIEVVDIATPATYIRYTGTWKGATMSWLPSKDNFAKNIKKTLPGLSDFYMAGQWLAPGGGIPTAMKSGRDALQLICKKDRKRFAAVKP